MTSSIRKADDYFHIPKEELNWRESYYFNFVNHDNTTSGFTTIGILPNQKKAEYLLALFHNNKQTVYFKEIATDNECDNRLSDKTLTYKLIEPLKKWEISFSGQDLELLIQWEARFPSFDFGKGSGTSWIGHFEQSGIARGEAKLRNSRKIRIYGYGQRDKSWGQRNWNIENWFALHAQFQTHAVGLRKDTVNGVPHVSGGRSTARKQTTVSSVDLEITYGEKENRYPIGALTAIHYADGKTGTIRSRLISPRSFATFSRSFPKGTTELFEGMAVQESLTTEEKGTGLIEFLFTHLKSQRDLQPNDFINPA
jgi:hypothetical protein